MTNVSAVEKMAELMQQMEENSPRVSVLQYCLKQVAEKVEEAEMRNAELEARCAALAAENAGLKDALEWLYETVSSESVSIPDEKYSSVTNAAQVLIETPATDAFLDEVRASELDSLVGVAETMLVKFSNQMCSSDMHEVVGWKMVHQQASNRAAQLRKGDAQ